MPQVVGPLSTSDDADLVRGCVAGDRGAERELFRRQKGRVHATLYRVLGSNRDMDDLVQEAFLEVFRSLTSFRGEAKLSTWIDRISVRVAYKYMGRRRATVPLEMMEPPSPDGSGDAEARAYAREGVRRLYVALGELAPHAQTAFALHVIDGRSVAEVAEICGASAIATKLRIWRARRELMKRASVDPVLRGFLLSTQEVTL